MKVRIERDEKSLVSIIPGQVMLNVGPYGEFFTVDEWHKFVAMVNTVLDVGEEQ